MKIRLAISDENMEEVTRFLMEKGIEIDDDAEYTLIQREKNLGHISVKNPDNGDRAFISVEDILYIESYGHQIEVVT